jgi:GntR family transcriptional regulator, transcriptional repressor for pyruvate dehydrogenase complex
VTEIGPGVVGAVARTTLVERTTDALLDAIREGRLAPGAKLPNEQTLIQELGVSRTALREALQRLVSLDVVDARHGRGFYVRQPAAARAIRPEVLSLATSPDQLAELLEARVHLESGLAALAARHATRNDLRAMEAAADGIRRAHEAGELPTEHDIAFHMAVAQAARNQFLIRLADVIATYLRTMRTHLGPRTSARAADAEMHEAIYRAIASGDAEEASAAMRRHLSRAIAQFEQVRSKLEQSAGPATRKRTRSA